MCVFNPLFLQIDTTPGKSRLIVAVAKKDQLAMPLILQGDFKYFVQLRSQANNAVQGYVYQAEKVVLVGIG